MKDLFKPIRNDFCNNCNTNRSIECFNKFDKPINYTYFLDQIENKNFKVMDNLDKVEIDYMLCKKCKTEYFMDWRLGYPIPVRDFNFTVLNLFLENIFI